MDYFLECRNEKIIEKMFANKSDEEKDRIFAKIIMIGFLLFALFAIVSIGYDGKRTAYLFICLLVHTLE